MTKENNKTSICVITVLDYTSSWRIDTKERLNEMKAIQTLGTSKHKRLFKGYLGLKNQFTQ